MEKGLILPPINNEFDQKNKKIIAVTMASSRQGISVVKALSKSNIFHIRALTRDTSSEKAKEISRLPNVELLKGDLLDKKSLIEGFRGSYGIFGNTTPTKRWGMDLHYERLQGVNLIDAVKEVVEENRLKHFIFSSICKSKVPSQKHLTPGHFSNKWEIENRIKSSGLNEITTVISPVSYFENFYSSILGITFNSNILPGIIEPNTKWQTVAVDDIGSWTLAVFKNRELFLGETLNILGENLSGEEMASVLEKRGGSRSKSVKYKMLPRVILKIIEEDIAIMANWIEKYGYGADIEKTKVLAQQIGVNITSLDRWIATAEAKKRFSRGINYINKTRKQINTVPITPDSI